MVLVRGEQYGTAAEIADRLGADVTTAMVRRWIDRGDLAAVRDGRTVYVSLTQAARIERDKRLSGRGRSRRVDGAPMIAA